MEKLNVILSAQPAWLIAIFLVAAGWLLASMMRSLSARLLALLHFNQLCERAGVYDFLRKGEVPFTPSQLVGRGLYWVIWVWTFLGVAHILDIGVAAEFRHRMVAAIPTLLNAALVLLVGLVTVTFISGFVRTLSRNAGSPYADLWSRITRWVGVILVLTIAFEQAQIQGVILGGVIQIIIAAFAFGMALAFGLGCKDMARSAMEKLIADLKERHRTTTKSDMEG